MPFPTTDDLCNLSLDDARRALSALRALVEADLATVYTRPRSPQAIEQGTPPQWNVWLEITRRRIELPVWAAEWLAEQDGPDDPEGDAA